MLKAAEWLVGGQPPKLVIMTGMAMISMSPPPMIMMTMMITTTAMAAAVTITVLLVGCC